MKKIKEQNEKFKKKKDEIFSPKINSSIRSTEDIPDALNTSGEEEFTWEELTLKDKMKMFNEWSVVILIGNILHVFGTTLLIINSKAVSKNGSLLVGFGTFFVWCSLLKYF